MRLLRLLSHWLIMAMIILSTALPAGQAQAQRDEPYRPSGIPGTQLGGQVPPGRLNVQLLSQPVASLSETPQADLDTPQPSALQVVPAITPEIAALAAGLENNPLAIYDYVYNHIDYIPTWGLLKNPRETLLAEGGNAFDQSALLVALLRSAGFQARYVRGSIRITKAQATIWVGAADPAAVGNVFASGGIPTVNEGGTLRLDHIWVQVLDGSNWRTLDPSFKPYAEQAGQDVRGRMGYDLATFLDRAQAGAEIRGNYTQNLNHTNIRSDLARFASNLLGSLRAGTPFAGVSNLIGGRRIVPIASSAFPPAPDYTVVSSQAPEDEIPGSLAYTLRIELPGIDYLANVDDIAGERITIFYECAGASDCQLLSQGGGIFNVEPAYLVNVVPRLRVGGEVVATGSPVPLGTWGQRLDVTFDTPIAGQPAFSAAQSLIAGESYALPLRLQVISNRSLARHLEVLQGAMALGLPLDDERVLGEVLWIMGLSYFNEVDLGDRIDSRLAQVVFVPHFSVMIASRNLTVFIDGQDRPVDLAPASHTIDVRLHLDSVISAQNPARAARERAWLLGAGLRGSAAEHAVLEQLQPVNAISTIQILRLASEAQQRLYYITSGNLNDVVPELNHQPSVINAVIDAVSAGRHVVISQNPVDYDQWSGSGWIALDPSTGAAAYLIAGSINPFAGAAPVIINGGSGTRSQNFDAKERQVLIDAANQNRDPAQVQNKLENTADPINTATGDFVYQQVDMASFGGAGIPLGFERFYSSSRHSIDGPLGFGWSHTYGTRFFTGTDWARAFGGRTAAEAVPAVVAAQVGVDLFDAASIPHQRFPIDVLVIQWLMTQVTGNAATLIEPDGTVAAYVRLADGSYQPPPGAAALAALAANADGTALAWESGTRLRFDRSGRLAALEDAAGNRTALTYDGQGRLAQVTDPAGRRLTFGYDGQGQLVQVADHTGRTARFGYDGQGNLQTATDPRGGVTTYAYDSGHRMTKITDPTGVAFVNNQYDPVGRVVSQVDGRGSKTMIRYGGDRTVVIDPLNQRTSFFFDARGHLSGIRDPLGARTSIAYDAADHEIRRTNALGQATTYAYDARGRLVASTNPLNQTIRWAYDGAGNPVTLTDQRGKTWRLAYDARHNLTGVTDPLGMATSYTYNNKGLVTKTQDAAGVISTYTYDAHGNLTCIANGLGQSSCWAYDGIGRATRFTDGTGHVTQYSYDAAGNLARITDALNHQVRYTYDANGNLAQFIDANGHASAFAYDAQFNLVKVTDAAGGVTSYEYDANDGLVRTTDAVGHLTRYRRDAAGRVIEVTDPLNRTVGFSYDAADRLIGFQRADGASIGYQRDALGRLTVVDYPTGPDSSYSYDPAGNLGAATYGGWSASYTYDDAGRLKSIAEPSRNLSVSYAYDRAGRRAGLRVARGPAALYDLAYGYDAAGRLTKITDGASRPPATTTFGYDAAGRLAATAAPSGARTNYTYANDGRAARVAHRDSRSANIATFEYRYDAGGNITAVTEATPVAAQTVSYSYDALDRLTRETYPRYNIDYAYDAVGNLIRRTDPRGAVHYTYDAADQLQTRGSEQFGYDQQGNLVSWTNARGTYAYTYDGDNLLAGLTLPGNTTLSFGYDAFGRRVTTQGPAGSRGYLHDGLSVILEGDAGLNQPTAHYVYGDGLLVARYNAQSGATTYHGDAQGNVHYLLGNDGLALDAYGYDAFGRPGAPAGIDPNPFRFAGQHGVYQDLHTGWHMGYRDYDPDSGRFTTRDPLPGDLMRPPGLNDYAYGFGNPLRYGDPWGLRPTPISGTHSRATARGQRARGRVPDSPSGIPAAISSSSPPMLTGGLGQPPPGPPKQSTGSPTQSQRLNGGTVSADLKWLRWLGVLGWPWELRRLEELFRLGELFRLEGLLRLVEKPRRQPIETPPEELPSEPEEPGTPWAAGSQGPDVLSWMPVTHTGGAYALACVNSGELFAGAFQGGVLNSSDAWHANWTRVVTASVDEIITGTDVYYAGTRFGGVLKKPKGGAWAAANNGLAASDVYALAVRGANRVFAGTEMGLFVSDNGGASWHRPAGALPGRVVSELAVDGNALLAVTDLGLYRSSNDGATWLLAMTNLPVTRINMLTVVAAGVVYAGTPQGLYKSTNGGSTWAPVGGLAGHDVHALAANPANPQHIVVGTAAGLFVSTNSGAAWAPDTHGGLSGGAVRVGALAFCQTKQEQRLYLGTGGGVYVLPIPAYLPLIRR